MLARRGATWDHVGRRTVELHGSSQRGRGAAMEARGLGGRAAGCGGHPLEVQHDAQAAEAGRPGLGTGSAIPTGGEGSHSAIRRAAGR